jgi:hypothetical protein
MSQVNSNREEYEKKNEEKGEGISWDLGLGLGDCLNELFFLKPRRKDVFE